MKICRKLWGECKELLIPPLTANTPGSLSSFPGLSQCQGKNNPIPRTEDPPKPPWKRLHYFVLCQEPVSLFNLPLEVNLQEGQPGVRQVFPESENLCPLCYRVSRNLQRSRELLFRVAPLDRDLHRAGATC